MRWSVFMAAFMAAALVVTTVMLSGGIASAQSAPATLYGKGAPLKAGDRLEASIGGRACASTTVTAAVEWVIQIPVAAPCGPTDGATVAITVNGLAAMVIPAPVWKIGATPPDQANGYVIQLGAAAPTPTASATPPPSQGGLRVTGNLPKAGGYGLLVVTAEGSLAQLVAASGCPEATMSLYATVDGGFVTYVPGTAIAVVNAAFLALYPGGNLPAGAGFVGRCL